MNSFMFAIENFLKTVSLGGKSLKTVRQNSIKKKLIFHKIIDEPKITKENANKKVSNKLNNNVNNNINISRR